MRGTLAVEIVVRRPMTMEAAEHRPAPSRLLAMAGLCAALCLAGCGHSDLKAPCEPAEGALGYAEMPRDCGPMRRVNVPFDALDRGSKVGLKIETEPLR